MLCFFTLLTTPTILVAYFLQTFVPTCHLPTTLSICLMWWQLPVDATYAAVLFMFCWCNSHFNISYGKCIRYRMHFTYVFVQSLTWHWDGVYRYFFLLHSLSTLEISHFLIIWKLDMSRNRILPLAGPLPQVIHGNKQDNLSTEQVRIEFRIWSLRAHWHTAWSPDPEGKSSKY